MKIKRRINWIIWKNAILAPIIIILFIVLVYFLNSLDAWDATEKALKKLPIDLSNPVVSGLLGAIVGGIFTVYGGIYTQARQFKVKGIVLRKNVIYSPLFDELVKLKKSIPKNGEYPGQIIFGKRERYHSSETLTFDAWERIKSDVRFIEVPTYLAKGLDGFQQSGEKYMELRRNASHELYNKILPIVEGTSASDMVGMLQRSGHWFFLEDLLSEKHITEEDIQKAFHMGDEQELIHKLKECLNACKDLHSVESVKVQYNDFRVRLDELINGTHKMIDFVQRKYEHKSRSI
ncbi:hypothetical protein COL23_25700 [Priestia aryabhattai]|uniref:hypothetical protein n=1 Tax=Priestia aryabhattai TaxID=412384 RepID=UPI000BF7BA8A|nr:hypothetical protein [Priestia aryabhattai]PFW72148.1 hypothetical protein COL23_25700 [Priestia aryabhattai]